MKEILNKVDTFLQEKGYRNQKDVVGVLLYGSAVNGFFQRESDIDLMIVKMACAPARGAFQIEDTIIEYFERSLSSLEEELAESLSSNYSFLLSAFQNGTILYDPYHFLEAFREKIIISYQLCKPQKRVSKDLLCLASLHFHDFYSSVEENSPIKTAIYYKAIQAVRYLYQLQHGFSKIPNAKVPILYENNKKATSYCLRLPNDAYKNLFLKAILSIGDTEREELLKRLWNYTQLKMKPLDKIPWDFFHERRGYSRNEIKKGLILFYNLKRHIKQAEESHSPYFDYQFHILLEVFRELYYDYAEILFSSNSLLEEYDNQNENKNNYFSETFLNLYQKGLITSSRKEQVVLLEEIIHFVRKIDTSFNPKNYYIKL